MERVKLSPSITTINIKHGLIAAFVAINLVSFQIHADDSKGKPDTYSKSFRSGAHGSADPHAKLTPEKHLQVAMQHLAKGRQPQAMETLNNAIEKHSDYAALYGVRGGLLLEQGHAASALADLIRAVDLDPHNPVFLTNRAQAYRQFGRTKEAMADLDNAIKLDSDFIAARFNRGSLAFSAGKYPKALEDFNACVEADPKSAAPYFNRASVHDAMGNRDDAIADLERFLEIAPSEKWKQTAKDILKQWQSDADAS